MLVLKVPCSIKKQQDWIREEDDNKPGKNGMGEFSHTDNLVCFYPAGRMFLCIVT